MKGNVIQMNTLHLNSVRLNGIGKVQSVSLKGGSTEDPVFPPVEPPVEPTPTYTLLASVANGKVSATLNGSAVNLPFTANEGDTIVVSVTPNDGYTFEGWADGVTDNPRSITMTADVVLSAQCVEVPSESKYIQFEDAEVERVLMSKGVSSDGVGITKEDAAAVTSISTWFKGNTAITSFDEFAYFKNCTTLVASAFEGCSNLASLPIEHIVVLNGKALYGCSSLAYDYLNLQNLTTLGQNALYGVKIKKLNLGKVTNLPTVSSSSTQNYGDKSVLEEVRIPSGVTSLPDSAFYAYTALKTVDNTNSIVSLANYAFADCTSLTGELNFSSLTSLGKFGVFRNTKITSIKAPLLKILGSDSNAPTFGGCTSLEVAYLPSVTSIGYGVFSGCTNLKSVTLGDITEINRFAFQGCKNLKVDINLSSFANKLGWGIFYGSGITSFVAPLLTGIDSDSNYPTFGNCENLTHVHLGKYVENIGIISFNGCSRLVSFICEATTPPSLHATAFNNTNSDFLIYVPDASLEAYKTATNWTGFASRIKPLSEYLDE